MFLCGILLLYFIQKKSAAEVPRILVETYSNDALSETTCRDWFRHFKNNDFNVKDKECSSAPKKFENKELEALLHEDACHAEAGLAESLVVDHSTVSKYLKALGMDWKLGHGMFWELKPRDVEWHLLTCEQLLQQQKKKVFFCVVSSLAMKSGYTTITARVEDHRTCLAMHKHRWQRQISMVWNFCSAFCRISWV